MSAWGKTDCETTHHLAHHSADVAAVLVALLNVDVFRNRASAACGKPLTDPQIGCLGALAFLHDIGKLAPAFQAKGWPNERKEGITLRGHLECGHLWLRQGCAETSLAGNAKYIVQWPKIRCWFNALFAHHGRPVPLPPEGHGADAFDGRTPGYDWKNEETVMGQALVDWFPEIRDHEPPCPTHEFLHFFCGLLALADWVGSDSHAFPFEPEFRSDYWITAKKRARQRVRDIGLDPSGRCLNGPANWGLLGDEHRCPRPAQSAVGQMSVDEQLVILEAETGSGKTEAALWRFARLYEARKVDALYFAVPTRAAARQLHRRVNKMLRHMLKPAPEAVLAIPGQAVSGEATGQRLPDFSVLWDDSDNTPNPVRWAAEHSTRYLAAQIAVGTVDQVMLGGLQVKHAHLRGSAMSRALLVIDEVHASDAWMTEIQQSLLRAHMVLGGYAMLMSATLGSIARSRWRCEPVPDFDVAVSAPYPAVWTGRSCIEIDDAASRKKTVAVSVCKGWSGADAATIALKAADRGARVLLIRNTVERARESWTICSERAPGLVLTVNGTPTLHHSRFAAEDRLLLDKAVENALGKGTGGANGHGCIVVGTQTLEQSLDIDADFLITDLCPMDVLLQRIGRLHRHDRRRPAGYEKAQTVVLSPEAGLDPLTRKPENGLGAFGAAASLSGIYLDVPALAATLERIEKQPMWRIPAMNRSLVEAATHPHALDRIAEDNGWQDYRLRVTGRALAEARGAELVVLDRTAPLPDRFPTDEAIRTRLGEEGVTLTLPLGIIGPFGEKVHRLTLPAYWSHGLTGDKDENIMVVPDRTRSGSLTICVADEAVFYYNASGLTRQEN